MAVQLRECCSVYVFPPPPDRDLERRIRGGYRDMPGLRLSSPQAMRLWSVDPAACNRVLDGLIEAGFLRRDQDGRYALVTAGREEPTARSAAGVRSFTGVASNTGENLERPSLRSIPHEAKEHGRSDS